MSFAAVVGIIIVVGHSLWPERPPESLLNVAYDSSRGLFNGVNQRWNELNRETGLRMRTTHAGSLQQTDALIRGLVADTICLSSSFEVDLFARQTGCIRHDWRDRFPYNSSPFSSTIVIMVRSGNPKGIRDWRDLLRQDVRLALPDPTVSGAGRYAYLSLLAALEAPPGSPPQMRPGPVHHALLRADFIPLGAHQAIEVFRRSSTADAFLTWESDALQFAQSQASIALETIFPASGLLAEPAVAIVDCQVDRRGSRSQAVAFLDFLFSDEGQAAIAKAGLRPRQAPPESNWPQPPQASHLVTIEEAFGSWERAWKLHLGPAGSLQFLQTARTARAGGQE